MCFRTSKFDFKYVYIYILSKLKYNKNNPKIDTCNIFQDKSQVDSDCMDS